MLYICATPIGNLQDVTLRVLRTLGEVDFICAEDTRHTRKLLSAHGIRAKLISLHEHNEYERAPSIVQAMRDGSKAALVSDAGLPGLSDPGHLLIAQTIAADLPLTVLPGANAAMTALLISGLPSERFFFQGFLPRKKRVRRAVLEELRPLTAVLIFYEAPHRLTLLLEELLEALGDRRCVVARELTKKYETVYRGSLSEQIEWHRGKERGEYVILTAGASPKEEAPAVYDVRELVRAEMTGGLSKKEAVKAVAKRLSVPRNEVYQEVLDWESETSSE